MTTQLKNELCSDYQVFILKLQLLFLNHFSDSEVQKELLQKVIK